VDGGAERDEEQIPNLSAGEVVVFDPDEDRRVDICEPAQRPVSAAARLPALSS